MATIRHFDPSDTDAVVALWRDVFRYDSPHNRPELAIEKKLAFQPGLFLVATEAENVVGTVMGGYDGHRGWIYSLAVAPDRRRQGIGSTLVKSIETGLQALGCLKINLQILADNDQVVDFYRRLGFVVEPRISMGKRLVKS